MIARYWEFCQGWYVKDGKPTGWQDHIRLVLRLLRETYGRTPAAEFGPKRFKAFRQTLVDAGHSRRYINKLAALIPRMFKWAASEELLPNSIHVNLQAVEMDLIRQALLRTNGNRSKSARLLGISRDTLLYRMQKYKIAA